MPNNYVLSIAIDDNGTKWIGTGNGLAAFDGTNWTVYNTSNSGLPGNQVRTIAIDDNGTKWIGTPDGLAAFDGTNWTVYNTSNSGLPRNGVGSIAIDDNGTKWIGTNGGLAAYNEGGIPVWVREKVKTAQLVHVYPNPVSDYVNIELLSNANISLIEIINIQGRIVKRQKTANDQKSLDVRDLPNGIYIIKMDTDNGFVMKKLIKQ